ncbi:MAG: helix-turn-helix transcriptional regulator [Candidatus Heimdallarchaeota archaeon]|nr:helix-turn-helix transcriptional regulator [Candidatus Heimdallarchaeota archaeon]
MEVCPGADTIHFLARKHMLKIIATLFFFFKPMRFSELRKELKINSKTLTDRLRELTEVGFINRVMYDEIPVRVEYALTPSGEDLRDVFDAINLFDDKHYVQIQNSLVNKVKS